MDKQNKNKVLLPSGFTDLMPPEAGAEADAVDTLLSRFRAFGYQRIKPPLLEFEGSLFAEGIGENLSAQSFRLMDPLSHKMMALRPDITVQISRITQSRLSSEERPLRLTYAGDVLYIKASQQRTARQFCKVGCELIGQDHVSADIEVCMMALLGLLDLGLSGIVLDLCHPAMLREFIGDDERLFDAVTRRDADGVPELEAFDTQVRERLKPIYEGVCAALEELGVEDRVRVSIDPLEMQGFEYQTGAAFSLFVSGVSAEIGRGGRYELCEGGEGAVGFTLYMDTVCAALPARKKRDVTHVPNSASWKDIVDLQKGGKIVIRSDKN